ncbi:MAG: type I-D CRISPR-associated protein Cas7/Csc2, partial [Sulfobacillus thermotolerans]|nr:type I-D CRISPR-associated protein Cas7/Csc2 [Sulfobacillus thermotolerans]
MDATLDQLKAELAPTMTVEYTLAEKPYMIPTLPQAQVIVLPVVREVVAPMIIRNNDAESITDIVMVGERRIRMIASKTKSVEKRRGAMILRALQLGGYAAANKHFINEKAHQRPSSVFDLNAVVFGDSAKGNGKAIYPVHAAVLYSDAISVQPAAVQTDAVFRQGGIMEDGSNYDPERHQSSSNIFTTRAVKPGTLFVQTLVLIGRRVTAAAFDHLLLSLGLAGAYGGSTATTGTNLRTYLAGIYWGTLEQAVNAPMVILESLPTPLPTSPVALVTHLETIFGQAYPRRISAQKAEAYVSDLATRLEKRD